MAAPARKLNHLSVDQEALAFGREVLLTESLALLDLAEQLGDSFSAALELLDNCSGHVVTTGMGKCGYVARKISATLASTGAPSYFLHPAEGIHGDLGRLKQGDVLLALSFSGETSEVVDLSPTLRDLGVTVIAMTSSAQSTLGKSAGVVLELGPMKEACELNLAPSTSTTAMLGLGDALALSLSRRRGFQPEDFARFHPGGSLGRKLSLVEDCMRPLAACRVSQESETVRAALVSSPGGERRTGAMLLVDAAGRLTGVFTDSDLARLLARRRDEFIDHPLSEVMTRSPKTIVAGARMPAALALLSQHKLSELPVVSADGALLGMIDITDVVGQSAPDASPNQEEPSTPISIPIRQNDENM